MHGNSFLNAYRSRRAGVPGALLILLLGLSPLAAQAQNLRLTLATQPPVPGVVSTAAPQSLSLAVLSGQTLSFARERGRDYRLQASGGFFWTQVQELPQDAETIVMTPQRLDNGDVEIALDIQRKQSTRRQHYRSTLVAQPGEWVQLFGPAMNETRAATVYGTQKHHRDSLYLRVE